MTPPISAENLNCLGLESHSDEALSCRPSPSYFTPLA